MSVFLIFLLQSPNWPKFKGATWRILCWFFVKRYTKVWLPSFRIKKKIHRATSDTSLSNLLTLFLYSWKWGGGEILTWYIQTLHYLELFNQLLWQDEGRWEPCGCWWNGPIWKNEMLWWRFCDEGQGVPVSQGLQHPLLVTGWGFCADDSIFLILFPQGDLAYPNAVITL